ncbi:MAG: aminoglycoside phosphotransferase family protein [Caldilineaceae bacterium]
MTVDAEKEAKRHHAIADLVMTILPELAGVTIERVAEGGSTEVYRIRHQSATYYLRVLPEVGASFAPEAKIHRQLHAWGVQVPDVLYFAHYHAPLGRSVMVTTEIPGQALGYGERHPQHKLILRDAGRDLAQTGRINVVGFGWIDRSAAEVDMLRAEHASFAAWIEPEMAQACATLRRAALLTNPDLNNVRALTGMLIDMVGDKQAVLAHGDFDGTHIYQQAGVYSGIFDFGEIRGANLLYDLGHFQMENEDLLPDLLAGYEEVRTLPSDALQEIWLTGLLIAVGRLANMLRKGRNPYLPYVTAAKRNLALLMG